MTPVADLIITPHSTKKSKPKHVDEFLTLYKKAGDQGDSYDELRKQDNNKTNRKSFDKQPLDVSQVTIDGANLGPHRGGSTPLNESKVSSTPRTKSKKRKTHDNVKDSSKIVDPNESMNNTNADISLSKSKKKRSKSTSFLLTENEELEVKKSKSETSHSEDTPQKAKTNKKIKIKHSEKENEESMSVEQLAVENKKKKNKRKKLKSKLAPAESANQVEGDSVQVQPKKQNKATNQTEKGTEKVKKAKKKKHQNKPDYSAGEPLPKSPKTEAIVETLENLNIGQNAHTLTNLIDEMSVVDKSKKKKARKTANRIKKQTDENLPKETKDQTGVESGEKSEEVKEKKWGKKRWGKNRNVSKHGTSIVVDNIPIALLFTYKAVLNELFKECGNVRTVGVAEVYPTEISKPVFTTTIFFATPEAATKALEKDGTLVKGGKLAVQPSRPLEETTLVLRSYGPLTEQSVVSMFTGAGRVRSIRPVVRGKKTMSTVFVDFDGPDSVERALQRSANLTIKNKKVIVEKFKFETYERKRKKSKETTDAPKVQSDSEDSP